MFTKARKFIEAQNLPWYILSAEYGLVSPTAEIEPYERTLNKMGLAERRRWASTTLEQLRPHLDAVDRVIMLAGMRYREFLAPALITLGKEVEIPLEGLTIGLQLRWFVERSRTQL